MLGFLAKRKMKHDLKRGIERAKIYGVDPDKYEEYHKERQKSLFMKGERTRREIQERQELERIRSKATRKERIKKGIKKGFKDFQKRRGSKRAVMGLGSGPSIGLGGGGPQFGVNKSAVDVKIKKKLW